MGKPTTLQVSYDSRPASELLGAYDDTLAVFEFGVSPLESTDPRHVPVALQALDTTTRSEVWRCTSAVETGRWRNVHFARSSTMTMGHIALDLRDAVDMRSASYEAYRGLQDFLRQSPHHCPMKIWNYIPGINRGHGDSEKYRQFCTGRTEALATDPAERPSHPAATAIGSPQGEPALQVYFLATALPAINVENPRQLNAWHYPRQYGPSSPLFSRGAIMQVNGNRCFLMSGTASVVGHESHHDNAVDQISESLKNVNSLLKEARRITGGNSPSLDNPAVLRVYIRDPNKLEAIRNSLAEQLPAGLSCTYLKGGICRRDLLTEIDGIIFCD